MKTKFKVVSTLLLSLGIFSLTSCNHTYKMSKEQLYDKLQGAWAGQIIGCTYGGPTEFRYCATMISDEVEIPWGKGEIKKWFDGGGGLYDDIYVDYTFIEALDKYGFDAPADSFATAFLAKGFPLCHSNQQSRYNLQHGCSASESGYWKNNPHANCLDFQIEADFAGIVTPGMVNSGVDICDRVGHMLAYGDGWYAGVYVSAMYSLAYIYDDINMVVTEALKVVPRQSRFYECISDVIAWHQENPENWKWCWQQIEDKWGSIDIACPDGVENPFNIEVYVNGAYIVLGLLYGGGDFFKTIDISTRAGQDSDCNPASAGGILGTMIGYSAFPQEYVDELESVRDLPFNYSMSFVEGNQMSFKEALTYIQAEGGNVTDADVVINVQKIKPVRYEVSFEGIALDKKISVENWVSALPEIEFEGIGAVIKGQLQADEKVPTNYVALLEVYFNDNLIETCELPLDYNSRKHELFFNYEQPTGNYKISCKWINPVEGADIWVRDVITYKKLD